MAWDSFYTFLYRNGEGGGLGVDRGLGARGGGVWDLQVGTIFVPFYYMNRSVIVKYVEYVESGEKLLWHTKKYREILNMSN